MTTAFYFDLHVFFPEPRLSQQIELTTVQIASLSLTIAEEEIDGSFNFALYYNNIIITYKIYR